jgi:uncharacterized membrane protein
MRYAALWVVFVVLLAGGAPATATVGSSAAVASDGHLEQQSVGPLPPLGSDAAIGETPPLALSSAEAPPETEIVIDLAPNRSAQFTITTRFPLETENETAAFRSLAAEYESGALETGYDIELFRHAAERVERAAGRDMAIQNVTRSGFVTNETGVLRLSFRWTNFLNESSSGLRLNDAFETPNGGTWLGSLEPHQTLIIRAPNGYSIVSSSYSIDNNSVVIEGPEQFGEDERIVVSYMYTGPDDPKELEGWTLLASALIVALAILAGAYMLRQRGGDAVATNGGADAYRGAPTAVAGDGERTVEPASDPVDDEVGANGAVVSESGSGGVDLSLLSDEERVEHLLKRNGGRMRQANIVKETGWSDAKVSQLLSAMADDGQIEKLRLGRENLISLAGGGEEATSERE